MSNKRVMVFGGTGNTGKSIVNQLSEAGHGITALVRSTETELPKNVSTVLGDVLDTEQLLKTVAEQSPLDSIVICLGSKSLKQTNVRSTGTKNILQAIQALEPKPRVIAISSAGVGDSYSQLNKPARIFVKTIIKNAVADHTEQEKLITESGLEHDIVRPVGLKDTPATGNYDVVSATGSLNSSNVSRHDVAAHVVTLVEDETAGNTAKSICAK